MNNAWSDRLKEETRSTLQESCYISPGEFLHMKNSNGNYGAISSENLLAGKLLIQDKKTDGEYFYTTTDELIGAGWVID